MYYVIKEQNEMGRQGGLHLDTNNHRYLNNFIIVSTFISCFQD